MSSKLLGAALAVLGAGCTMEVGVLEEALKTPAHKASVKNGVLTITGTPRGSRLALRLQTPSLLAVDVDDDGPAEFVFDRSSFDRILIDAGDGDDQVRMDESNGAFTHEEQVTILGGPGNDTLLGGIGAEVLQGGAGDDFLDGGPGADTISMGDGNDTFVWDPGDGSDVLDGDAGSDAIVFNGANIAEQIALSANGSRLRFTRDIAAVVLDAGGVESVAFVARGGSDHVMVNNLAGTPVTRVSVDLTGGDLSPDVVTVEGTTALTVAAEGASVVATGQAATVAVMGGEPGLDALEVHAALVDVNGSASADTMEVSESGGHALVAVAGFNVKVDAFGMSKLSVNGLGGDDLLHLFSAANALPVQLDGGDGNDQIFGGNFPDLLIGGPGDDVLQGGPGADTIMMGDGNDTFVWNPGDGSDLVEGEAGNDAIVFNGANIGEIVDLSPDGSRLRLTRDIAAINLSAGGVERVDLNARGGADHAIVHDLSATQVTRVNVEVGAGDGAADVVTVERSDSIDVAAEGGAVIAGGLVSVTGGDATLDTVEPRAPVVKVNGSAGADTMEVSESGGHALVSVTGFNVKVDAFGMASLSVNGLGGDDFLRRFSSLDALPIQLDGGDGNDQLFGGNQPDLLLGGPGDDVIHGGPGADTIRMGDGNDTFVWDPGDASDVVEGEAGTDAVLFNGANIAEQIALSANGSRLRLTRDIGAVTLDAGGIERVDVNVRGGSDRLTIGDFSGTAVTQVNLDLAALAGTGTGDAVSDQVVIQGSPSSDVISVSADPGAVIVSGLAATTRIITPEPFDQLTVNGLGGLDAFSVSPGVDALIALTTNQD